MSSSPQLRELNRKRSSTKQIILQKLISFNKLIKASPPTNMKMLNITKIPFMLRTFRKRGTSLKKKFNPKGLEGQVSLIVALIR